MSSTTRPASINLTSAWRSPELRRVVSTRNGAGANSAAIRRNPARSTSELNIDEEKRKKTRTLLIALVGYHHLAREYRAGPRQQPESGHRRNGAQRGHKYQKLQNVSAMAARQGLPH